MALDILRKLTAELVQPITTERQVVYILCQVRKIVDGDPNKQRWKSLKLYCDWAMHSDLKYDSRTRPFIQEVENFFMATFFDGPGVSQVEHEAIQKLIYLDGFREDLDTFLIEQGLPNGLTGDSARWKDFLRQYGGVINDGSLVYKGSGLLLINQMKFTALPPFSEELPFNIEWEIQTKDGQVFSLTLHPNWKLVGSQMTRAHARRGVEPETPPQAS